MLEAKESPYFFRDEAGALQQAVAICGAQGQSLTVTVDGRAVEGLVPITSSCVLAPVPGALPGQRRIWHLGVTLRGETVEADVQLGTIRPFTIYVAQDKHLDYGWKHPEEEISVRMHEMMDFYVDAYLAHGDKYNLDCLLWVEQYVSSHTREEAARLLEIIRCGGMAVSALPIIPVTGILTGEEMVQAIARAHRFARKYDIPIEIVVPNEAPSMSWGLASCLAGTGIRYLARGAYQLANPHIKERDPIPVYYWEGPDGGRVLVHFAVLQDILQIGGYAEARPLRMDDYDSRFAFVEHAIATYEGYGDYDLSSFMLLGSGWDEYPRNRELSEFIRHFNTVGFAYPKLVDANYLEFFADVEAQIQAGRKVPVLKGDYGSGWEIWGSQLAYPSAVFRRARRNTLLAQTACAISTALTREADARDQSELDAAFDRLIHFADHNFGGILPMEYDDMRDKKLMYAQTAMQLSAAVLERALGRMKPLVSGDNVHAMVFNPAGQPARGAATVRVDTGGQWQVCDPRTGSAYLTFTQTRGVQDEHYVSFLVEEMPAYGIAPLSLRKLSDERSDFSIAPVPLLENAYFKITFGARGLVDSVYSKKLGRELLNRTSAYRMNGLLHEKDGTLQQPASAKLVSMRETPLEVELVTQTQCAGLMLTTHWTLPKYDEHMRITNHLYRDVEEVLSSVRFSFPLDIPAPRKLYDSGFASIVPDYVANGGNLLPGATTEVFCALSYVNQQADDFGVTVVWEDSFMFELDAGEPGTLFSLVHSNATRNDFIIDQGGQRRFTYTFYLHPYEGDVPAVRAEAFSRRVLYPLQARLIGASCPRHGADTATFGITGSARVLIDGVKPHEEGGVVVRMRSFSKETEAATLRIAHPFDEAWLCDLAGRAQSKLEGGCGEIPLLFAPRQMLSVQVK